MGAGEKDAVTLIGEFIVTLHDPVPLQPPDHPENTDPLATAYVNVTSVPVLKLVLAPVQVGPQLMPLGDDVTVPVPVPVFATVSVCVGASAKVAVMFVGAFKVNVQVPDPEHPPPDQPEKTDPLDSEADSVIGVPAAKY